MEGWTRDRLPWRLSLTLSPPLIAILRDPLRQSRFREYLARRRELASREITRTLLHPQLNDLARLYHERFGQLQMVYEQIHGDPVAEFARNQMLGNLEILACAATHAFLPVFAGHRSVLRGQIDTGCHE